MCRTRFDIADIVRLHRTALEAVQPLSSAQGRVLTAITLCRTAALGGHWNVCLTCGYQEDPSYNSCRNRHCPKCQALAQERWIAKRAKAILPIPPGIARSARSQSLRSWTWSLHFHGVFTLPEDLRSLARQYPKEVLDALFQSVTAALLDLGRSRLGVTLGLTLILHTWTRELLYHLHVHVLITAGGLLLDGSGFKQVRRKVLLHPKPLAMHFKKCMMDALRGLRKKGAFTMTDGAFNTLMASIASQDWHVYLKRTFHRPEHTLQYLGRYTHRVGISNSRILDVTDQQVTFRTKDGRKITVTFVEFLRRFVLHVLPDRFKKIRHAGLYASTKALALAKTYFESLPEPTEPEPTWEEALLKLTGKDVRLCPLCGSTLYRKIIHPALVSSRRSRRPIPRSPP